MWRRSSNGWNAARFRCYATRVGASTTNTYAPTASRKACAATALSSRSFFGRASRTTGFPFAGPLIDRHTLVVAWPGFVAGGATGFSLLRALARQFVWREPAGLVVVVLVHFVLFAHMRNLRSAPTPPTPASSSVFSMNRMR